MPRYEDLRLRTGEPIVETWYDTLINILEDITEKGAVDYSGYVHKDLIPDIDLALNLGIPEKRFKEIHVDKGYFSSNVWIGDKKVEEIASEYASYYAFKGGALSKDTYPDTDLLLNLGLENLRWLNVFMGYGYASYAFYVDNKPVLKDGDPITVQDLGDNAKTKITQAINDASITSYNAPLHNDLENILNTLNTTFTPFILNKLINTDVSGFTDVFSTDLICSYNGRVRFKFTIDTEAYTYVKWIPAGLTETIISSLNANASIPANAWHEFDFTVVKNDKINFRTDRPLKITLVVYNIPNA